MYHFVECEPCVVNYVVDFAKSSAWVEDNKDIGHNGGGYVAYLIVASTMIFGKSSAPTSPATESTSPPLALISCSTACRRVASMLRT